MAKKMAKKIKYIVSHSINSTLNKFFVIKYKCYQYYTIFLEELHVLTSLTTC